jgi:flagellar basal-body rod protein FlgC
MDLKSALSISSDGLRAQSKRLEVISENIANADSTASAPGGDPYRRKVPVFRVIAGPESDQSSVAFVGVRRDATPFPTRIEPGHPAADQAGVVKTPNIDPLVEQMDLRDAQRSYEANLNVLSATRRLLSRTIDILKA